MSFFIFHKDQCQFFVIRDRAKWWENIFNFSLYFIYDLLLRLGSSYISDTYLGGEYLWGVATFTILLIKPYFKLALVASVESCWLLLIIIIKELFFTICVSSTTFNQAQKYALII